MDSNFVEIARGFFIKSDTIFSVGTTFTVFLLGLLLNGFFKAVANYKKRDFNRKLVKINLPRLIEILRYQAERFDEFVKCLEIESSTAAVYRTTKNPHIQIIYDIGYADLHKAYFSGIENIFIASDDIRVESFGKLWNSVDDLQNSYDENANEATRSVDALRPLNEERNSANRTAMYNIDKFMLAINLAKPDISVIPVLKEIAHLYSAFNSMKKQRTPRDVDDYLKSLDKIFADNFNLLVTNLRTIDVFAVKDNIQWANYKFINQEEKLVALRESFKSKIKVFTDYVEFLEYANKHLYGIKSKKSN